MNEFCLIENKKSVERNGASSDSVSGLRRSELNQDVVYRESSPRSPEAPMRLKRLISAAVRVWELKRGLN